MAKRKPAAAAAKPKPTCKTKASKPSVSKESFKNQANTDYPMSAWDTAGRKKYDALNKQYQLNPKGLSKYFTYLVTTHFPKQRKEFSVKASKAEQHSKKKRENRRASRALTGLLPVGDDERYSRQGAKVRTFLFSFKHKIVLNDRTVFRFRLKFRKSDTFS